MWKVSVIAALLVLGVVGSIALLSRRNPTSHDKESTNQRDPIVEPTPIVPRPRAIPPTFPAQPTLENPEVAQPPLKPQPRVLRVPPDFADFETWSPDHQLNAVTDVQRNAHLSPAMRDFLVDLASDPSRRAVLRNNAANALGIQDPPVAGWLGMLADQALDPAETAIWRDYALQHLSDQLVPRGEDHHSNDGFIGSSDSGLDRTRYIAVLTAVATSKLTVAGTALLHLDRLSRQHGVIVIDQAQFRGLVLQVIEGDGVNVGAKVTAFGIMGMRGDPADADFARRFLNHGDANVRRASVAALGLLGTEADIPIIEAVDATGDSSVEMAKTAACKRLSTRAAVK